MYGGCWLDYLLLCGIDARLKWGNQTLITDAHDYPTTRAQSSDDIIARTSTIEKFEDLSWGRWDLGGRTRGSKCAETCYRAAGHSSPAQS